MNKINIIFLFFICIFTIFSILSVKATSSIDKKIIVVDPGHGNVDPGCSYGDIYEKDINLSIGKYLEKELIKNNSKVIMTRNGDYDLALPNANNRKMSDFNNRINIINNKDVDMYISIHLNYLNDSSYYGPQVFYNKDNYLLAKTIQEELNKEFIGNRSIKKIPTNTYMYSKLNKMGVLVECGFLSNYEERNKLMEEEYQKLLAKVIVKGIKRYYN
jgi:N-acetylmuramoyl-L-alanine amidase